MSCDFSYLLLVEKTLPIDSISFCTAAENKEIMNNSGHRHYHLVAFSATYTQHTYLYQSPNHRMQYATEGSKHEAEEQE